MGLARREPDLQPQSVAAAAHPAAAAKLPLRKHRTAAPPSGTPASAAIPAVFCPITTDGELHVDGGALAGLDLETAAGLGARNILAIDLSLCRPDPGSADALQIWRRGTELTLRELTRRDLERFASRANIVYACPLGPTQVSPQDFSQTARLIAEGEAYGNELVARVLDGRGRLRPAGSGLAA